jgi:hypothetical protein
MCAFCDDYNSFTFSYFSVLSHAVVSEHFLRAKSDPTFLIDAHIWSSQGFSAGGRSGMKMKSAPALIIRENGSLKYLPWKIIN